MATPTMKLDMGRRGLLRFTPKEIRVLIIAAATLVSTGIGYVIRCEVKFATLETQLEECRKLQKPSPAIVSTTTAER